MACWQEADRRHIDMVEEMTEGEDDGLEGEQHLVGTHALLRNDLLLQTAVQPLGVQNVSAAGQQVWGALQSPKRAKVMTSSGDRTRER